MKLKLTRLCLGLNCRREHKLKRNFLDIINPLFSCSLKVESTSQFLLRQNFTDIAKSLMNELN